MHLSVKQGYVGSIPISTAKLPNEVLAGTLIQVTSLSGHDVNPIP